MAHGASLPPVTDWQLLWQLPWQGVSTQLPVASISQCLLSHSYTCRAAMSEQTLL